jgi:hypothetical protein
LAIRCYEITENGVIFRGYEMGSAVVKMPTHARDAACEVTCPRTGISVLEGLVSLGGYVRGATSTDIEPERLHCVKAGWHRRDVLPRHGENGVAGIVDHVHQLQTEA